MAEISSGGGKNLPGGGEKIVRYAFLSKLFLLSCTTLLIYAHFVDILNTCYKEIHEIYCFTFSGSSFIFYTQVWFSVRPRYMGGEGGIETPLKWSGGGEGAAPPP